VLGKSKGSNAGSGERRSSEGERQQGREPSSDDVGHREYGAPVLSIMEEPSPLYADLIYDSSGSRIPFAGIDQGQHPFEENGGNDTSSSSEATFQPPEETTTSSSVASALIIEVWGIIVPPWTARTVEGAMPNFSSTSLIEIGSLDST